jgi:hypothetical protein
MLLEGKLSLALGNDRERHFQILRPRSRAPGRKGGAGRMGSLQRAVTGTKATCTLEVVRPSRREVVCCGRRRVVE